MSENGSRQISLQALGRNARLGDLYNARTENFCLRSIFRQQLPEDSKAISRTDTPYSDIQYKIVSSFQEKLKNLNISGELQLSVLSGKFKFSASGSAKYLSHEKNNFKSVECMLLYHIKTVTEHLELFYDEVQDFISQDAVCNSGATHVVTDIEWGAKCVLALTDQNSDNKRKNEVEGKLHAVCSYLSSFLLDGSLELKTEWKKMMNEKKRELSLRMFGDLIPDDSVSQEVDEIMKLVLKLPELVKNYNDGKGKPVSYLMLPVSYLHTQEPAAPFRSIGEDYILKIVQLFDHIREFRQKVCDQLEKLNNHSECATNKQLEETHSVAEHLAVQEAKACRKLDQLLENIRSGTVDEARLDAFYADYYETASSSFRVSDGIFKAVQAQIEFRKHCERYGAEYIEPVKERIARACDDYHSSYVLFYGEGDS